MPGSEETLTGHRRRKPRFRDVAAEAGVGTATVERVLNGRGNVTPATARRVLVAAQKLGYDRTLPTLHHAAIRIEVILVRPDSAFFDRLNRGFKAVASTLERAIILHRTFLRENTPEEVARRIESAAGEREALIVVVQDDPRIVDALRAADRRGVPVVLLVSDVGYDGRAYYVGIDNESAGRTAGYMMRQALGGRRGTVLTLCHSGRYPIHRQRVIGFSQYFPELSDDRLLFTQCLITLDAEDLAYQAVSEALSIDPDVVGIYHAGGGTLGVARALEAHGRLKDVVYLGHELSPTTRRLLENGAMLLAIDQEPELQVRRALETVEILLGLRDGAPDRTPIPFRIITPENLD